MATCYDCIHTYSCKYDRFFGVDDVENKCHYFKNKADFVEVKHGHWIKVGKTNGGSNILQCSVCGTVRKGVAKTRFCKDCGAKMDVPDKIAEQYGEFENTFCNRTKADPTAKEAIRTRKDG